MDGIISERIAHNNAKFSISLKLEEIEPGGLRITFSDVGGPTMVGADAKENFWKL